MLDKQAPNLTESSPSGTHVSSFQPCLLFVSLYKPRRECTLLFTFPGLQKMRLSSAAPISVYYYRPLHGLLLYVPSVFNGRSYGPNLVD